MDPPPYPGYVVQTLPAQQPVVVTTHPNRQIVTQQVMPNQMMPGQTVSYIHVPTVQPQYVQQQTFVTPAQAQPVQQHTVITPVQTQPVQQHTVIAPVQTQPAVVVAPQPSAAQSKNYAATAPGIFKILEFFSLLIAWACAARYKESLGVFDVNSRLKFFLAICIIAWLLVMLFFFIFVAGVHKHCGGVVAAVLGAVTYGIFTLMLLICSGLLADDATTWRLPYRFLHGSAREYVNNLYAAVAFGFVSALLFFIDAILFCADNANRVNTPSAAVVVQQPAVVQPNATVVHVTNQ